MAPLPPSTGLGCSSSACSRKVSKVAGSPGRAFEPLSRLRGCVTCLLSTVRGSKMKTHIHSAHVEHEQKVMNCSSLKWWISIESETWSVKIHPLSILFCIEEGSWVCTTLQNMSCRISWYKYSKIGPTTQENAACALLQ